MRTSRTQTAVAEALPTVPVNPLLPVDISDLNRSYSLYVLEQRAIPHVTDGLKSAARRVVWRAKDGKKVKTAALAGATMSIHPHGAPEGAINTQAGFFTNNCPIFKGFGAFGTLLEPTEFGAGRYTYVQISDFTKDVLLRDIEIIPMVDNYDSTELEPKHFLPLIPTVLVNPQDGIATGFASTILPRDLGDIVKSQIAYLNGTEEPTVLPNFSTTDSKCVRVEVDKKGVTRYVFAGEYKKTGATSVKITKLPYGTTHAKFMAKLYKLEADTDRITDITDNSVDVYDIDVTFKRGFLVKMDDAAIMKYLNLEMQCTENLNVIDFNSTSIYNATYEEIIQDFTEWRLLWYVARYKRLKELLEKEIQRYRDIILAIEKNVGGLARKTESREELKELLEAFGIVSLDYIADLSVYRFTEAEAVKTQVKLDAGLLQLEEYNKLLGSKNARKQVYLDELGEILTNHKKGKYVNSPAD